MAIAQTKKAQTPAEKVRDLVGDLESKIGKLGFADTPQALEILYLFDQADALMQELEEQGLELTAERARFTTTTQQFRKKSKAFLKQVGGTRELRQARDAHQPPEENWWWYLDQILVEERQSRIRATLQGLALATVILAAIVGAYMLFLRPDKATRQRITYEQQAERALTEGTPAAALEAVNQALGYAPDDNDLLITKGVSLVLMGEKDQAEAIFSQAMAAIGDKEAFYTTRAEKFMMGNRPDLALQDAKSIVGLNPDSGMGYFVMGNANASLGNLYEASLNYDKASELAKAAGETELEGMARVQLANLMMMMMGAPSNTATPNP